MTKATIEICTRDIAIYTSFRQIMLTYAPILKHVLNSDPQHLFILFTNEAGHKTILRGGPEKDTIKDMFIGNIKVVVAPYVPGNSDKFPNDYSDNPVAKTIFTGTDAEMKVYMGRAIAYAELINKGEYDYKLPVSSSPAQNSNAVVKLVTEFMELPLAIPKDPDNALIWAPGIKIKGLEHTKADYILAEIKDRIEKFFTPALIEPNGQRTGTKWDDHANLSGYPTWKVTEMETGKFVYIDRTNGRVIFEGTLSSAGEDIGQAAHYASAADLSMAVTSAINSVSFAALNNINNHMHSQEIHPSHYEQIDFSSVVVTGHKGEAVNSQEETMEIKPLDTFPIKYLHWDNQGVPYYE
jgi:hypothetical protein